MRKGFYTQGVCVLLSRPTTLDEIAPLLHPFSVVKRVDQAESPDLGGPSLILAFRPEVNGYVSVDLQDRPWPDHMGDPKGEPQLFAAWSMGHFGPFAFPGNLQRAAAQSWGWSEGEALPAQHRAFIRVRSSYVFGGGEHALVMPKDYEPIRELGFVTRVARALLAHPAALAYFNPNGELLTNAGQLDEALARPEHPPIDVWCNVRLLNPGNGWLIMDTAGMGQLDRPDCEACFPEDAYEPDEVARFLRNCSLYLLDKGDVVNDGDTMNGPGGVNWRAHHVEKPLTPPPRRLLRWFPQDGSQPPPEMGGPPPKPQPGLLGRLFGRK